MKKGNLKLKLPFLSFLIIILHFTFYILHSNVLAVSPAPKPTKSLSPTPTVPIKISPTPSASASATPKDSEEEKVKEIREAIKEKVNQIKEKIEKKAYVGLISQITDSTITIENFRGKQRVRLLDETNIIGANKKEIKAEDLAVDDKVIALGVLSDNEILEAKRLIVVPLPKTPPAKRIVLYGTISAIDSKKKTLTIGNLLNLDQTLDLKIEEKTRFISYTTSKASLKLGDLKENQKVTAIYPEPAEGKTPILKTLFLLP